MFGEYAIYVGEKVVGLVCDNQLFVKPTNAGRALLKKPVMAPPYSGAKPAFLIAAEFDDSELVSALFKATANELPEPTPKKPKAKKKVAPRRAPRAPRAGAQNEGGSGQARRRGCVAREPSRSAQWLMLGLVPVMALLLRTARRRPGVRMEILERQDFTDERIAELHAMACRLMAEDLTHFRVHAETNDVVHIFRRVDTGELVGFQFWRTAPMTLPGCRAILGGKLRILPAFRGRGLHLLSGLLFFLQTKARHPLTRYYRLSIASLFGFVSITEALRHYHVLDPHDRSPEGRAVMAAFAERAAESHYRVDPETALIFVDIFVTPETLAGFGPSYFERPAARRYAEVNPGYRSNGCFVGVWWRFTPANLLSLIQAIRRKLWRHE